MCTHFGKWFFFQFFLEEIKLGTNWGNLVKKMAVSAYVEPVAITGMSHILMTTSKLSLVALFRYWTEFFDHLIFIFCYFFVLTNLETENHFDGNTQSFKVKVTEMKNFHPYFSWKSKNTIMENSCFTSLQHSFRKNKNPLTASAPQWLTQKILREINL